MFRNDDPVPYCVDGCSNYTHCGDVIVPANHLDVRRSKLNSCRLFVDDNCKVTYRQISYLSLPAALRAAQICRYLVYSEADFEVFRPAGATRCTDGGEIWQGGGDLWSPPPRQISPPSVQRQGCGTPKIEIFTQI